jgi:glycosyltransferase involved in cell wall biosynthesis
VSALVVVDGDVLGRHRTGDESYVENLVRELGRLERSFDVGVIVRHAAAAPDGVRALELPTRSQVARMTVGIPRFLKRVEPSLVHFLYVAPPVYRGAPVVLTVHDLSFASDRDLMDPFDRTIFRTFVPRSIRRAARVLTGSHWTRERIAERYGVSPEKIVVTPYGVDPVFTPEGPRTDDRPYLLFVGALQPRKDPLCAVRALALLDPELELVFVGPEKRGGNEVWREVARLGLEHRVRFLGHVSKEELCALYRGAVCLVLPSRDEGFGLPILEAMAVGTPVVASTAGALPEVAGEAAVLVPPRDPEALADGVERALTNRDRLRALGLERSREFTWQETARRTAAVYEELL